MLGSKHLVYSLLYDVMLLGIVAETCEPSFFTASHKWHEISTDHLSGEVECTWIIKPKVAVGRHHYLEIQWTKFTVESNMPECSNHFVEVKIKREKFTLGRICSGNTNMTLPFDMYSTDGYAAISFRLNTKTGSGFALKYAIKKRKNHGCRSIIKPSNPSVANIFAVDAPLETGQCKAVLLSPDSQETRIVFMEFNFQYPDASCASGITLTGSEVTFQAKNVLLPQTCGRRDPFTLRTTYRRVDLVTQFGSQSKRERGIIVGLVRYGKRDKIHPQFAQLTFDHKSGIKPTLVVGEQVTPNMTLAVGLAVGLIIGGIVLCLLIPVAVFCCRDGGRHKKSNSYQEMSRSPGPVREIR